MPDGNTIIVLDADYLRRKVTFKSIRAAQRNDVFAKRAKQYLSPLVYGKQVRVDWDPWDRYGRMVGRVLVEEKDVACAFSVGGCDRA